MRKLLFLVLLVIGAGWLLKGHGSPEDRSQSPGWSLPTVAPASGLLGTVTALLGHGQGTNVAGRLGNPRTSSNPTTSPGAAKLSAQPAVTTTTGSHGGTSTDGAGPGLVGNIPPELMRFMNPSLLTTTPTGTRDLSPAARLALQQIMAQARANPAAFKEQFGGAAKALRGSQ